MPYLFTPNTDKLINFKAIVATDRRNIIGYDNDLIFHNPDDLKFFKEMTMGTICIMGRKTFESIGRILPDRLTIVVTHDIKSVQKQIKKMKRPNGTKRPIVTDTPLDIIPDLCEKNDIKTVFVCGGVSMYVMFKRYIVTWIVTYYKVSLTTDEEGHKYLPKNYDPEKLVRLPANIYNAAFCSCMKTGEFEGIDYAVRLYIFNLPASIKRKLGIDINPIPTMDNPDIFMPVDSIIPNEMHRYINGY